MLSVSEAEGRAGALVEAALQGRGRCGRRPLYRRCLDRGAGAPRRAGGCDPLRGRGDRPAPVRRPPLGQRVLVRSVRGRARRPGRARRRDGARGAGRPLCRPRARRPAVARRGARSRAPDDGADPSPVALKERALATEEAARAVAGITNSEGAGVSAGRTVVALATSARLLPRLHHLAAMAPGRA